MTGTRQNPDCTINGTPGNTLPTAERAGLVTIEGMAQERPVEPTAMRTLRPDVFQPGQFSVFDALVQVCEADGIAIEHHFDECLRTHLIDSLAGEPHWWYAAAYHGGHRPEEPAHRMDAHPYRDWMTVSVYPVGEERVCELRRAWSDEVRRLEANGGRAVVPEVGLKTLEQDLTFADVEVTAHDLRVDLFQPGVLTVADIMLSLADRGDLSVGLEWTEMVGPTLQQAYYFTRFNDERAGWRTGFTYEVGERVFTGREPRFSNNRLHVTADMRAIVSPEYVLWSWTDLSGGGQKPQT
jgi:hypothetical protein